MKIEEEIKGLIINALSELGADFDSADIGLEHPADLEHGDYASNVAMVLFPKLAASFTPADVAKKQKIFGGEITGKRSGNPRLLAQSIVKLVAQHEYIEKIEIAGPGFINFYLSGKFFEQTLVEILEKKEKWGNTDTLAGKKVMVEYTDPNPFKEIHIGHLVPNSIGVALARIVTAVGADVREVTFQGDVGMHVAKAMYGMQKLGITAESDFTATDLGKAYATGATAFEESENAKAEITALNKRIYQIYTGEETELKDLYEKGKQISLDYFDEVYALLNSNFKHFFFESETGVVGEKIVRAHVGDVFEESRGAVIFPGEKYGLHTRVFINKEGLPTYEAKDVGLVRVKQEWWEHDISVTITGAEQESYFNVMKKAVELIDEKMAKPMRLVVNGMLSLKNGKMSSRTGQVIRAVDLIADIKKVVRERMTEADDKSIEQVAVGALKYSILRTNVKRDIIFDFETSISFEGDSGPYLQYTYARCKSVLAKAGERAARGFLEEERSDGKRRPLDASDLEKLLYRFTEVVERAALEYEPHHIANYLNELASSYNSWYGQGKILDGTDAEQYKLAFTEAVAQTLKNGLDLLGIECPERM